MLRAGSGAVCFVWLHHPHITMRRCEPDERDGAGTTLGGHTIDE
jgi:hypothetical protein